MSDGTDRPTGPVAPGAPPGGSPPTAEEAAGAAGSAAGPFPPGASPDRHSSDSSAVPTPDQAGSDAALVGDDRGVDDGGVDEAEAAVVTDLGLLEKERDEFRTLAQRIQADFENFKKQTVRRQTELLERAGEDLVHKLLPVLDTADLAVSHDDNESLLQLASALYDALLKEGLERIDPQGEAFDPNEHDAVMHEPGDGAEPQVLEVLRAGYRWKGRLLRPAMVKVKG